MSFVALFLLLTDIYLANCFFKNFISIAALVLQYLELIKLELEHTFLYQLLRTLLHQLPKK